MGPSRAGMHGMRPFGALLSKEDALRLLLGAAAPVLRDERVPLAQAHGRVLSEDITAPFDVPPFARSMMDGYAIRSADAGPRRVVGEVFAGATALPAIGPGEAVRIATGAPIPPSADAVCRVEDTHESHGLVTISSAVTTGRSIEPAGADMRAGETVARAGDVLTPARAGLLASIGRADARVRAKPRVAIAASGDELLAPGTPAQPYRIYDSNSTTLAALAAACGAEVTRLPALPDELGALEHAIARAARDHDAILVSGGASAGARDLLVDAAGKLGRVLFHGVRVKPGKPLLAARIGDCLLVGLPGNPTSALSNACLFVAPALRQMAGLPPARPLATEATLTAPVRAEPDRYLFLPARVEDGRATPTFKGSGALTSMAASDGWIGVPEGADLPTGARVTVHAWW